MADSDGGPSTHGDDDTGAMTERGDSETTTERGDSETTTERGDSASLESGASTVTDAADVVVVPIEPTSTLRATVGYVTEAALRGDYDAVHFIVLASWRAEDPDTNAQRAAADRILDRARAWIDQDVGDVGQSLEVQTAIVGEADYLFGPSDFARRLIEYAEQVGANAVVLDPEYTPVGNTTMLQPMEFELAHTSLSVTEAPVERPTRRERLTKEVTGIRFASLFGVSLLFYFVLGDPLYWFDWVTGVASATIVAITLSRITFDHDPRFPETPLRIARFTLYVPVLLLEIVKSNLLVARVILDPRLPIDPTMNRVRVLVGSGLPLMTLSNSITLTPGTLTTRARDENLYVHSLIPWARDGLFDGSLERWTRFVYYGRGAARLPTPRERDDVDILQGPDATDGLPIAHTDGGTEDSAVKDVNVDSAAEDVNVNSAGEDVDSTPPAPPFDTEVADE